MTTFISREMAEQMRAAWGDASGKIELSFGPAIGTDIDIQQNPSPFDKELVEAMLRPE